MNNIVSMMTNSKGRRWAALGFFVVFSIVLYIGYSQIKFKSTLTVIFQEEQSHNVVLIQNLIKEHLDEASQNLQHAADMITVSRGDLKAAGKTLDMIMMSHSDDFSSLLLIDSYGKVLASSGLSDELVNLFERIEIEQDIEIGNVETGMFLSERTISENGQPTTFLFAPFSTSTEQPGHFFVAGELNLKNFVDKQLAAIQGEESSFVVADDVGDIYSIVNKVHKDFPQMARGNLFALSQECLGCHEPDSFDDIKKSVDTGKIIHELFRAPDGEIMNRTASTLDILKE